MNKTHTELVDPKLYLLEERTKLIAFLLGIVSVLLCGGLWWGDLMNYHIELMTETIPREVWTVLLFAYAVVKINPNTNPKTNFLAACCGLWLWIYVFLTFVVFDTEPATLLESMLLLPIILETWELALTVVSLKLHRCWRAKK